MQSFDEKFHMNEELNERCFFLKARKRWWVVPVSMVIGALVCFLAYFAFTTVAAPARSYDAVSKLYLTFAADAAGNAKDYYNGATWTDLLTSHPGIYENIEKGLPEGTDLETVKDEVKAEILTDIRLMTVTVTDNDPERAEAILTAVDDALVEFGNTSDVFEKIEFLSRTPAELVTYSYKTKNAAWLGLFLGAVAGVFLLLIGTVLDDAIYVPEEAEKRYSLPVAGVKLKDGSFYEETKKDYDYLAKGAEPVIIKASAGEVDFETLRKAPVVFVEISCGKKTGTETENFLSRLQKQDVKVQGILLTDADGKFLDGYYRRKKDGKA